MLRGGSFTSGGRLGSFTSSVRRVPSFSGACNMGADLDGDVQVKDQAPGLPFGLPKSKKKQKQQLKQQQQQQQLEAEQEAGYQLEQDLWREEQEQIQQRRQAAMQQQQQVPHQEEPQQQEALKQQQAQPQQQGQQQGYESTSDASHSTSAADQVACPPGSAKPATELPKHSARIPGGDGCFDLVDIAALRPLLLQRLGAAAQLCDAALTMVESCSKGKEVYGTELETAKTNLSRLQNGSS